MEQSKQESYLMPIYKCSKIILTLQLVETKILKILLHWGTEVIILQWKHYIKRPTIIKICSQFECNMDPEHGTKKQLK